MVAFNYSFGILVIPEHSSVSLDRLENKGNIALFLPGLIDNMFSFAIPMLEDE